MGSVPQVFAASLPAADPLRGQGTTAHIPSGAAWVGAVLIAADPAMAAWLRLETGSAGHAFADHR